MSETKKSIEDMAYKNTMFKVSSYALTKLYGTTATKDLAAAISMGKGLAQNICDKLGTDIFSGTSFVFKRAN